MALAIHIDSPLVTIEEFHNRSGIPISTIRKKVASGEFPTVDTRLDKDRRSCVYINLLKLAELAHDSEYLHPGLKGS